MNDTMRELLKTVRERYGYNDNMTPNDLLTAVAELTVNGAFDAARNGSTPGDLVCLIRILAEIVEAGGVCSTLCQLAQIAAVLHRNVGGSTYGCVSHTYEEDQLPLTVLLYVNRKNMSPEQIAEHVLRHAPHADHNP